MSIPKSYIAAASSVTNLSLGINYTFIRLYINTLATVPFINCTNTLKNVSLVGFPSKYKKMERAR